ncbi:MAG: type II toxin-antitoxin system PemK/MazF family toxin [Saprospiraceae bacterium]|nr:type II toxin-antitoxin system PemK/MazF family toxin [Saprospiraceae bacterium]
MELEQYSIVLVNLDPTIGSEIKKPRPCLIISPNELNHHLNTVVIAPITSKLKILAYRIEIFIDSRKCWIMLEQVRPVDKQRISKIISTLTYDEIFKVKAIIKEMYVD